MNNIYEDLTDKLSSEGKALQEINLQVTNLMIDIKEHCSTLSGYDTIMMNLINISKEMNNIRVNEITGGITQVTKDE